MKGAWLIILGLMCHGLQVSAQEPVLEVEVEQDTVPDERGPNRLKYQHAFYGFGYQPLWGLADELNVQPGLHRFDLGTRGKHRFSDYFSVGYDSYGGFTNHKFKPNNASLIIDSVGHDKQKLQAFDLAYGVWTRFQFNERGNRIGFYVDLGAYGQWNFFSRYVAQDKKPDGVDAKRAKLVQRGLDYQQAWHYGAYGRIGYQMYAIRVQYRLTDWYDENHPAVSPLIVTLEIGLETE